MSDEPGVLGRLARRLGREYGEARAAYRDGRGTRGGSLPTDESGNVRIVCRRYAERRAVAFDDAGRPACFDPDHQDCQGCVEDVRDGQVETW
ncbi:MAG: hypothetical protein ABEJ23_09415 [Haloarculaceae archaeon]